MRIAYASTRGWNVGDDFIRLGCEYLMDTVYGKHQRILYDKSEHVRRSDGRVWEQGCFHGNSLHISNPPRLDLCVVAGTPANSGAVTEQFLALDAPLVGLALGADPRTFSPRAVALWKRAGLITTRCKAYLPEYQRLFGDRAHCLPCTSLFAAQRIVDWRLCRHTGTRVALGWKCRQGETCPHNGMPDTFHRRMLELYRGLMHERGDNEYVIVCHHIDELADAERHFPDLEVRYGYDEHDFGNLYADCDFVISPRVHGIGMCAGIGIGGVLLPTDGRAGTVEGFFAGCTWDMEEILGMLDRRDEIKEELARHFDATLRGYIGLIQEWRDTL